jgi:pimeloyl-ACP methyl ester carboxylesterase
MAIGIAAHDSVAGMVLFSAFPSFGPLVRQRAPLLATLLDTDRFSFDARENLAHVRVPTMVITGGEDRLVRIRDAESVLHRAGGVPADLVVVEGGGHNGLWRNAIAWQAMNRLLDRALPGGCTRAS